MQQQRLGKHGQLGRAEFVLAVVADDEMFEHGLEFRRKAGYQGELGLQHLKFDHHVAEKLASRGVGEGAVVRQLMNLADVVQKSAGEEKVAIDLRIIPA